MCGAYDNFDLYLGDGAIDPLLCPATDPSVLLAIPVQDFTPFHGEAAGGDWTLGTPQ